jgi:hypothetical protein
VPAFAETLRFVQAGVTARRRGFLRRRVTIIENDGFLTGKSDKQNFFLYSAIGHSNKGCLISIDNHQRSFCFLQKMLVAKF